MTVDRLGALEAVARAARNWRGWVCTPGGFEDEIAEALAALDAASPLTTPTPDQGAVVLLPCPFCGGQADPHGWAGSKGVGQPLRYGPACDDCGATADSAAGWNRRVSDTAAASEARAAALFEAECELIGYHSALRANEDRPGITAHECAIIDCAIAKVRALATPAPGKKP